MQTANKRHNIGTESLNAYRFQGAVVPNLVVSVIGRTSGGVLQANLGSHILCKVCVFEIESV